MSAVARPLTEVQFQRQVTDAAELYGWTWAHFRPARTQAGWRTPVSGPGGKGFPDLVLWRERVIFIELKTDRGRVSDEQSDVWHALHAAGAEVYLFRPRYFDDVLAVLARREPA